MVLLEWGHHVHARDHSLRIFQEILRNADPCCRTFFSGIPELIVHGETGWLVAEQDVHALARALRKLISNPELRERMAKAGCDRVREHFSMEKGIDRLVALLEQSFAGGVR